MNRRRALGLFALGGALACGLGAGGGALAGPPVLDDSGQVAILEAHVSPPRASSKRRPQGVSLELSELTGNILTGQRPEPGLDSGRRLENRLPKGFRINYKAFPACRANTLQTVGPEGCPPGSVVGSGSAIVDARPLIPDFIRTTSGVVYNARGFHGEPAIVVWVKLLGVSVANEFYIKRGPPGFGPTFVHNYSPVPPSPGSPGDSLSGSYEVTSFNLKFPDRSHRFRGKRVHLIEAPKSCHGSWLFEQVLTTYRGEKKVVEDRAPCVGPSRH